MKHKKLAASLSEIRDDYITEAAHYKKRRYFRYLAPIAAVLAVAILAGSLLRRPVNKQMTNPIFTTQHIGTAHDPIDPGIQLEYLVAKAEYPKLCGYPLKESDSSGYGAWRNDQLAMHTQPEGYADSLDPFWSGLLQKLVANTNGNNITCSPVNIYMALAMLAETTDGKSRQQIMDVLGADSIEDLRTQAKHVWQGHYNNDGLSTSILANALWLEEGYGFNEETVRLLAEEYYASVFQGDLGSEKMNKALQAWLNEQTGGLLEDQIENVSMDPTTVLALASTIYYQVQWVNGFNEKKNTEATFHGAHGDTTEDFMNTTLTYGPYYWGENFGAVALDLEDGSRMWLFLPDEGYAPEDIADEMIDFLQAHPGHYQSGYENQKDIIVNLSLPKFDISADLNLADTLKDMGITDIFDANEADFSPILPNDDGGYITDVKHAARVTINEDGVTAAAFTLILRCGAALPPEDEIDFVLDRPFLFCVESQDGLPLFTGVVNEP